MQNTQDKPFELKPFVKWVGGKRTLVDEIQNIIKLVDYERYFEPFVGGGAVFLNLKPQKAFISDFNEELIIAYNEIKKNPERLYECLNQLENSKSQYLTIRGLKKDISTMLDLTKKSNLERASRLIYLNKTCFNGIWRENRNGEFNVPYAGNSMKPKNYLDLNNAIALSEYFNSNDVIIKHCGFEEAMSDIACKDLVYLDPPYFPLTSTSNFTAYTKSDFAVEEQERLKQLCDQVHSKGGYFILSNSSHEVIRNFYEDYYQIEVHMRRSINSKGDSRSGVTELLITNIYDKHTLAAG